MAPGANYMGGKRSNTSSFKSAPPHGVSRNAARARSKDTTGRAHKNYFGRQRLDILSKGLSGRTHSGEGLSGHGPRISASNIELSHARRQLEASRIEEPSPVDRASSRAESPHSRSRNRSHMRSSSGSRSSKILEALDTTEPLARRAAMDKILSLPDLAGLSTHTPSKSKRSRPKDSEILQEREQKRQKARVFPSSSPSSNFQQDENLQELEFEYMDMEDSHIAPDQNGCQHPEQENDWLESALDRNTSSLSSLGFKQPKDSIYPVVAESTWDQENQPPSTPVPCGPKLLPPSRNRPPVSLSSHSAGLAHTSFPIPPSEQLKEDHYASNANCKIVLRDSLYDYQDPWSAIGVILGLEEEQAGIPDAEFPDTSGDVATAVLPDQTKSPQDDTTFGRLQHFDDTSASNSAPSSPLKSHRSAFLFSYAEGTSSRLSSPAVTYASQSDSDDSNHDNNYLHAHRTRKPEVLQYHATEIEAEPQSDPKWKHLANESDQAAPTNPSLSLHAEVEALGVSKHPFNDSNPTTPTNTTSLFLPHEAEALTNSGHSSPKSNPTTPNTDIQPFLSSHRSISKHCVNMRSAAQTPITPPPSTHVEPRYESNPPTPDISVASGLHDFEDERSVARALSPSPCSRLDLRGSEKFQKFDKFPPSFLHLRRPVKRSVCTKVVHSPRVSSNSSPPPPSQQPENLVSRSAFYLLRPRSQVESSPSYQLETGPSLSPFSSLCARSQVESSPHHQPKPLITRSPFSFLRIRPQEQFESSHAAEAHTDRIFNFGQPTHPVEKMVTDIQDTRHAEQQALVRGEDEGNIETERPEPARFFADICLFADDNDAADSDE
ncbi:hypothetical protein B0H12DRAFT_1140511 [Mycena haematopus]|nr:hypothetical protein B0H12DRAFT_1140511 [Mycena haematopus]